jgi:hypothetical protein
MTDQGISNHVTGRADAIDQDKRSRAPVSTSKLLMQSKSNALRVTAIRESPEARLLGCRWIGLAAGLSNKRNRDLSAEPLLGTVQ